ncbi:unnamed protein product, partial [marine sediment metagenome]
DETIENKIRGSVVNHTELWGSQDDWNFNITRLRFYIDGSGTSAVTKAAVYEYIDWNNAGDFYGDTGEKTISDSSTSWRDYYPSDPISLPEGHDPQYYGVVWGESVAGDLVLIHDNNPTSDGEYVSVTDTYDGNFPDPMTGETGGVNIDYWVRGYITAYNYSSTTFNQYYGNVTEYYARRDFNITFPTSSGEQIQVFYPKTENIDNVTYSNGGLFDLALSTDNYTNVVFNTTHRRLTLPTATIDSYG